MTAVKEKILQYNSEVEWAPEWTGPKEWGNGYPISRTGQSAGKGTGHPFASMDLQGMWERTLCWKYRRAFGNED